MFSFIKANENPTPSGDSGNYPPIIRFTPSIYFGNGSGFNSSDYDIGNENTLKQFKVSVGTLPSAIYGDTHPMMRLDTVDLYHDFDHTLSGNKIDDNFLSPRQSSAACPVKFQRVHFYGQIGPSGGTNEYYSIFLAGYPVPVTGGATGYDNNTGTAVHWTPEYAKESGSFDDRFILGGAGGSNEMDFAFKITATDRLDEQGEEYNPPKFDVSVLGGSAQVLGGEEKIFNSISFTGIDNGEYFYIRYKLWDINNDAICSWDNDIQHAPNVPSETTSPKSLTFALGQVTGTALNNVIQFRFGSVMAVATINASPEAMQLGRLPLQ